MKHFTLLTLLLLIAGYTSAQNDVTFRVDMNQYGTMFTTPEVNGDFNGWCGGCNGLTDVNNDGIWETTLPLTQDSIEFKYAHDAWAGQENLTPGLSCTKTTGGFTNRFIHITGDTILPIVCWEACIACGTPPDTNTITFQVDMTQYTGTFTTPEVNGDFNGWCGGCAPMTDANNDGIWDVAIDITADSIEWKYAYDNWAGQEALTPGTACTKTTSGFTNRFMYVTADTTLPAVCWDSCAACFVVMPPQDSNMVTFSVDMADYTGTYTSVELNGDFNGWCGSCTPMTNTSNDVWEVTIPIGADTIQYKFTYDNWTGQENFNGGEPCTITENGFTNRYATLSGDTSFATVCYNSCDDCDNTVIPDTISVTFQVNVSEYTGSFTTPEVNGTFNGWCGNCNAMTDVGNGKWAITIDLPAGLYEWKFSHDNWTGQESLTEGDPCTMTTDGFTNRFETFTADTVLPAVCWESCDLCLSDTSDTTTSIREIRDLGALTVYPNPANTQLTIETAIMGTGSVEMTVMNTMGQTVYAKRADNQNIEIIDVSAFEQGMYLIMMHSEAGTATTRVVVSR